MKNQKQSTQQSLPDLNSEKTLTDTLADALFNKTSSIVWAADDHLKLVFSNENFHQYFSVTGNIRQSLVNKVPQEIMNSFYNYHLQVLNTGDPINKEVALQTVDGNNNTFYVTLFPFEFNGKRMIGGRAIKLEHTIENEQLQQMNKRLLNLIHTASNAIWEWDIKTGKTFRNQALLDMIGYAGEDTNGLTWWLQQIHDEDRKQIYKQVKDAISKRQHCWGDTYRFKCKDGSYKHISDRGFIIYENGFPVKMIGSLRDVTEVKELENQLAEERLLKQKEISENVIAILERERTFIGHELHDNVNQLLAVVKLFVAMLTPASEKEIKIKRKTLEHINTAVEEIRNLSKDLVSPQLKQKGLVASIGELVEDISFSDIINISFTPDREAYPISSGKKVTLYRAVQEQLKNILKYSKATDAEIKLSLVNNEVKLTIQDNGIGFDAGKKFKGIGLSNIQDRTKFYNGMVDIETAEGKGCKLVVSIPVE